MVKRKRKHRGGLAPDKYLTVEQVVVVRKYLDKKVSMAKPGKLLRPQTNRAIFDFMINTGLRAEEVTNVKLKDLPLYHRKNVINVIKGKGNVARTVSISKALTSRIMSFVKQYRHASKPSSFLFVNEKGRRLSYRSLYSRLHQIGVSSGVGPLSPHMLRHSYAMNWYRNTKDLFGLQDQLGHISPKTTHIYARTTAVEKERYAGLCDL